MGTIYQTSHSTIYTKESLDFRSDSSWFGIGQIDFVDDADYRVQSLLSSFQDGKRLCLHALCSID